MAIHGLSAEDRFKAASAEILDRFGVTLTLGNDFNKYREYAAQGRPDHSIGDPFNTEKHDMRPGRACWIVGHDDLGRVMHLQVLRVLPTEKQSVADYFLQQYREFSPPNLDIDFTRSRYRPGPGAKSMKGKIVYSGETWVGGEPGQYRGTGISAVLGRFTLLSALKEFSADHVLGFMLRNVAFKGFSLRFGLMHAEPMALRWFVNGSASAMEALMVYASAEDIRFMLDLPAAELEAMAA